MIRIMLATMLALAAAVVLMRARGIPRAPQESQVPTLSPFSRAKANQLIREKLSCLGCHQLDGEGGRIGPDLSDVGARRSASYIGSMIRDPQGTLPGTVMPMVPMPPATRTLIVNYLVGRSDHVAADTDPAPPRVNPPQTTDGAMLYARFCASCHGAQGGGDGFNAQYLPVPPTVHAESAYMAERPDDVLYDAISAGGYVMNRSHRMPAYGHTLGPEQIRALVHYLRELCRCKGPEWSRDDLRAVR